MGLCLVPHCCLYVPVPCAPLVSMGLCPTGVCMGLCPVPHWCLYVPVPCAPLVSVWGCALCPTVVCMDLHCVSLHSFWPEAVAQSLHILTTTNKYTVLLFISLLISCYMFRHICHHKGADTILLKLTAMRLQYEMWKVKNALVNKHTAAVLSECTIRKQCLISRISIVSWYDMIYIC
jgi:hypothetical protein